MKLMTCLNTAGHKDSLSESIQCSFSHANGLGFFKNQNFA